jgi:hypothetical protein
LCRRIAFGRGRSSLSYGQFGVYVRSTGGEFSGEWHRQQWRMDRSDWLGSAKKGRFYGISDEKRALGKWLNKEMNKVIGWPLRWKSRAKLAI